MYACTLTNLTQHTVTYKNSSPFSNNNNNNNNNNPLYSFVDEPLQYASQQLTRRTAVDNNNM